MTDVHITEDHNDVLHHIYRAIGAKKLQFDKNVLIHFDSHPDLLIPDLPADDVFDKSTLLSSISIENWIIPALYAGHINTVIWLKKSWAAQMEDGRYQFKVGRHNQTGQIRCSCSLPYFVGECLYADEDKLENEKRITLLVLTVVTSQMQILSSSIRELITAESGVILDIDLDYFSTSNPFIDLYTSRQLEILETLYKLELDVNEDVLMTITKRKAQLQWLKDALIQEAESNESPHTDDSRKDLIAELISLERKCKSTVDAGLLHEHGCTFDTTGLPHHISSDTEIHSYIEEFTELITCLDIKPHIITIARSSDDDYCPKHQVDYIQEKVTTSLKTVYNNCELHKHYLS